MNVADLDELTKTVVKGWERSCIGGCVTWRSYETKVSLAQLTAISLALQTQDIRVVSEPGQDWGGETGRDSDSMSIEARPSVPVTWIDQAYGLGQHRMVMENGTVRVARPEEENR